MRAERTLSLLLYAAAISACAPQDVHPIRAGDARVISDSDGPTLDAASAPDLGASWVQSVPYAEPVAIAAHTGAGGDFVITGSFNAAVPIRLGSTELTSAGTFDIFVARFSAAGELRWAKRYGAAGDDRPNGLAMDGGGNVALTGYFSRTVTFGAQNLRASSGVDLFVLKLDSKGDESWAIAIGGAESVMGEAVAFDGENIVVGGTFFGTAQFGVGDLTSAGDLDAMLFSLDGMGQLAWFRRYGGPEREQVYGVAADGAGNAALVGFFNATADFGGVSLTSAGQRDAYVLRVDDQGATRWARRFGGAESDDATDLVFEPDGDLWITGAFAGNVTFGTTSLQSAAGTDIFLARLDAAGEVVSVRRYGEFGRYDRGVSLALDGRGGLLLAGVFRDVVRFGPSELSNQGLNDVFVAQLDSHGDALWAEALASTGEDYPAGVAVASEQIVLLGSHGGPATFAGATLAHEMGFPMFLVAAPLP